MTELPSKQKVEIQRCSQAHFEKIFTPLKNDSESIYKKLEELEFREVPDTDHYYDESIEVVNGLDEAAEETGLSKDTVLKHINSDMVSGYIFKK